MTPMLWTQRRNIGPVPRSSAGLAFDIARSRTVLFGGWLVPESAGDTWEWDGRDWTQVSDIGPPARVSCALAYDSKRKRVVLFGGGVAGDVTLFGDTWEWNGSDWTQVANTGPSPRQSHAMTYDAARNRVVLFGGFDASAETVTVPTDTWAWDGAEWTQEQDTGPSARVGHGMIFDAVKARVVLFGGSGGVAEIERYGDTWEYDGFNWTHATDIGASPRAGFGFIFDGKQGVLFGGQDEGGNLHDTWTWDGQYWTERQDMGPQGRVSLSMAYDSTRKRTVVFGGEAGQVLGDTWELDSSGQEPPNV